MSAPKVPKNYRPQQGPPNRNAYIEVQYLCTGPSCGQFTLTRHVSALDQNCQCGRPAHPVRIVRVGVRTANRWAVEEFNPA
jgi:hypothetical protein